MKKRKIKYIILFVILAVILCALLPSTRSYVVMRVYSVMENSKSVMHENNFKIDMHSSKEWYPFVITFNPVNFGKWSRTGADMSIMYNFARFNSKTLSSDIFNAESDKHSSFYGAYALSQSDGYFGYENGSVDVDEIILTFIYDYKYLVLEDLGCSNPTFKVLDLQITDDVNYLDIDGWTKIDAEINTNAMLHNYEERHTSYMQYGKPSQEAKEDFPVIKMYGRLYIKAFDEYNSTIIIYVMSPSMDTINQCDNEILTNTSIKDIN